MTKKICSSFVIAFAFLSFQSLAKLQVSVITFNYPPYMFEEAYSPYKGLEIDIFEAMLTSKSFEPIYTFYPIKRAISFMKNEKNGEKSIYIGTSKHFNLEISLKKFSAINFGEANFVPYIKKSNSHLFPKKFDLDFLKTKKIAAIRGSSVVSFLHSKGIYPVEAPNFEVFFNLVAQERVDVAIVLEMAGDESLNTSSINLKNQIAKLPFDVFTIPLSIVIPKKHPYYKEIYQELLSGHKIIKKNGTLIKILNRYFIHQSPPRVFFN